MAQSIRIIKSKFDESVKGLWTLVLAHSFFVLCFLINGQSLLEDGFIVFSFANFTGFLILKLRYAWKNRSINILVTVVYFLFFLIELMLLGIPNSIVEASVGYTKGILFDMFFAMVPLLFIGLKFALIFPLIYMCFWSDRLANRTQLST